MLWYLITSDHQLYRVTPLKTSFGLLTHFIYNLTHVTTITIISYAVSHLHSLQSYTSIFHSWRLHIFTLHINIQFTRRNPRRDITPRIHFLRLLLNNWLVGLLLTNWLLKTDCLDISVPLINPQSYKRHCSNEPGDSCVASGHCVYMALPWKRAWCRLTSSRPVV
jgi:hypothetical protein